MNRILALFVIIPVLLLGCATATGPLFKEAPVAPEKKATLYFYRNWTIFVYNPTVKIDGKPFADMGKTTYSYAYLAPGVHKLELEYHPLAFFSPFVTEFVVDEGQVVFKSLYDDGHLRRITDVPKEKALEELKEYRFVEQINMEF